MPARARRGSYGSTAQGTRSGRSELQACTEVSESRQQGKQVAVEVVDPRSGTSDLWIHDVSRDAPTRLTSDLGSEADPVWSPDGRQVVFRSDRDGPPDLYRKTSSGIAPAEVTAEESRCSTAYRLVFGWRFLDIHGGGSGDRTQSVDSSAGWRSVSRSHFSALDFRKAPRRSHRMGIGSPSCPTSRAGRKCTSLRWRILAASIVFRPPAVLHRGGGVTAKSSSTSSPAIGSWRSL